MIKDSPNSLLWGIDKTIMKLLPFYLFFDAYLYWFRLFLFYSTEENAKLLPEFAAKPYDSHYLLVIISSLSFLIFCAGIFFIVWILNSKYGLVFRDGKFSYRYLFMSIILSSFGKLSTILMMIWDYDINFGKVVSIYVLASNVTSISVCLECSPALSFIIVLFGFLTKSIFHLIFYAIFPSMKLFVL
jgi:hypothetical protein